MSGSKNYGSQLISSSWFLSFGIHLLYPETFTVILRVIIVLIYYSTQSSLSLPLPLSLTHLGVSKAKRGAFESPQDLIHGSFLIFTLTLLSSYSCSRISTWSLYVNFLVTVILAVNMVLGSYIESTTLLNALYVLFSLYFTIERY